ncbi:LysR family transcriptional regulator [Falsochrobactrum sp. TDYN1]|uniref:LysR family transcriptional regulator n=2 Tax=Falsochrobactrum tianjinense TaxID=2706015 RepID=A0A949PQE0_9HYPH|nr:LysR family transcriptional regulator [Falsochrobactrum sp. TDYN1]MBV2145113.1 LysR family transcriptional regulator [Falsochrobactrum sp. TDYN1]
MSSLIQTLAVAEYLNFRHAASALRISQSSVSARVKALEDSLGILLFERRARGVRLTAAGRHFVEQISAGINQIDHAVKTAGAFACGDHGHVHVGVHALTPGSFPSELLAKYHENYPHITVEVTEGTASEVVMQLRAGRIDVAFVFGSPELPDCHSRHAWTETLLAALPVSHRLAEQAGVTWADLANETFLVRHGGTGPQVHDHIVLRLAGHWPPPSILRFGIERSSLLSMVGQGFGISVVGTATSRLSGPDVVFRPVIDEPEPVAFSAVWSPYNRSTTLRNLLSLADEMGRSIQPAEKV